jgi:ATP-binding cassette subfamily B (MDR/TAP) protein 1
LQSANLLALPGQLTAIVGLSGSGKSTVASLISRFYDPQSGDVLLDGRNIKDINVRSLRGFISLVQQEPSLLDRSILENIALGLVNSPPHAHLEKTLLSGVLARVAEDVRNGSQLSEAAEKAGKEVGCILEDFRYNDSCANTILRRSWKLFNLCNMLPILPMWPCSSTG